ncbi:MAG: FumA C-terminus/TtdB family hydratase beta subunit [Kiloniellales bacterium]|nr:FumA C-terminus/TtdB family hydratase beta subunit [Kiloniellales bacterium]
MPSDSQTAAGEHISMFPLGPDATPYRKLSADGVARERFAGETILTVESEAIRALAEQAFFDINHLLRPGHLQQLRKILDDSEASSHDRFVAFELLKNANISAGLVLPMCQDTGTAIVMGKKGRRVWTEGKDEAALAAGARDAYVGRNLRYSQLVPRSTFDEVNSGSNLPAQIEIYAEGEDSYRFLFIAKGGGSANKTFLFQATPATLQRDKLMAFLDEKIRTLGTAACPPYHLAVVIGGTSAELNLKTVKLASCRYLDSLPTEGAGEPHAIRDLEMEEAVHELTRQMGIGAQFGGKYFCHDVRVIRLPRHGASLPIGIGVSCSADRQALGKITGEGVFLEELETDPARYLPEISQDELVDAPIALDLRRPMSELLAELTRHPIGTRLSLNGPMTVARDLAHARLLERMEAGEDLPDFFRESPIYYAGPAKTPEGYVTGSFGPTTSGRMDAYADRFQGAGGSMISVGKGNRSPQVREACAKHGGFYLASIGGPGARLAQDCIKQVDCLAYPELGMEAIWRIEVEEFPAFIVIDDKGGDFFKGFKIG